MVIAAARTLLWTLGPPGIRFLTAAFGLWGVALAVQISRFFTSMQAAYRIGARVLLAIVGVFLTLVAVEMALVIKDQAPWRVVLGLESRVQYLENHLDGFPGWEFVRTHLLWTKPEILLVGDARHYYCPDVCDPEADQFTWTRIAMQAKFHVPAVLRELQRRGITHLWLHKSSMRWLVAHDVQGWVKRSYTFLNTHVLPQCGALVYEDEDVTIMVLPCLQSP